MKRFWFVLILATLACNLPTGAVDTLTPLPPTTPERITAVPPTQSPTQTHEPTATEMPVNPLPALIESVSAERLIDHVEALAAIESRHVNTPGVHQAAEYIYSQFAAAEGRVEVRYEAFPLNFNGLATTQRNVIAVIPAALPGSDPGAGMIVVGAHYDSRTVDYRDTTRAPGADDNASGTAAVIELARVLAESSLRQTVVLIAFSAEEVDKSGSIAYVQGALRRGERIEGMIALDIVGNAAAASGLGGEGAMRVYSPEPNDSASRELARFAAVQGEGAFPGFDMAVQAAADRPGRWSDHYSFFEAGIPAIRFISLLEDVGRQHSPADTADRVSSEYLRQATQIALVTAVTLADGPPIPDQPTLNGDRLTWPEVSGASGYVVALRGADSLEYGALIEVTGTTLTSTQFGDGAFAWVSVAARDDRGLMSPFSTPVPIGD